MTAAADFIVDDVAVPQVVRSADGGRMLVRLALRMTGTALLVASLALWFAPGADWGNEVMLFKLILSVCAGLAGLGMWQGSARPEQPQIVIDTVRRELRLLRPGLRGRPVLLRRCRFGDLSRVEKSGAHLRLWDECDALLAEVTLSDHRMMRSFVGGLRDTGKLE